VDRPWTGLESAQVHQTEPYCACAEPLSLGTLAPLRFHVPDAITAQDHSLGKPALLRFHVPDASTAQSAQELARAHTRLADLERKFGFGEFGSQSSKDADAK